MERVRALFASLSTLCKPAGLAFVPPYSHIGGT
jgi:hypothetical protein